MLVALRLSRLPALSADPAAPCHFRSLSLSTSCHCLPPSLTLAVVHYLFLSLSPSPVFLSLSHPGTTNSPPQAQGLAGAEVDGLVHAPGRHHSHLPAAHAIVHNSGSHSSCAMLHPGMADTLCCMCISAAICFVFCGNMFASTTGAPSIENWRPSGPIFLALPRNRGKHPLQVDGRNRDAERAGGAHATHGGSTAEPRALHPQLYARGIELHSETSPLVNGMKKSFDDPTCTRTMMLP